MWSFKVLLAETAFEQQQLMWDFEIPLTAFDGECGKVFLQVLWSLERWEINDHQTLFYFFFVLDHCWQDVQYNPDLTMWNSFGTVVIFIQFCPFLTNFGFLTKCFFILDVLSKSNKLNFWPSTAWKRIVPACLLPYLLIIPCQTF